MNAHLALLGARRTAHPIVLAALAGAAWIALGSGTASELAADAADPTARAGAWTEAAWAAFLALVAPCVVLRAAALRSRGEVAWLSVSRTAAPIAGVARSELALGLGAVLVALAIAGAWSAFTATGPATPGSEPAFAGHAAGPARPLVDHGTPLSWRSPVPSGAGLRARVDVSLILSAGGGGEARLTARRTPDPAGAAAPIAEGRAHVLPRGGLEVLVPDGAGEVEFELSLPEPGARGYLASGDVTLWRDAPAGTAQGRIAARVALALGAWAALAFGLGAWLAPWLALWVLACGQGSVWWSEAWTDPPRWLPGASLARDLAYAAEGRAPAALDALEFAAAGAAVLVGLALCRRGPEGRP